MDNQIEINIRDNLAIRFNPQLEYTIEHTLELMEINYPHYEMPPFPCRIADYLDTQIEKEVLEYENFFDYLPLDRLYDIRNSVQDCQEFSGIILQEYINSYIVQYPEVLESNGVFIETNGLNIDMDMELVTFFEAVRTNKRRLVLTMLRGMDVRPFPDVFMVFYNFFDEELLNYSVRNFLEFSEVEEDAIKTVFQMAIAKGYLDLADEIMNEYETPEWLFEETKLPFIHIAIARGDIETCQWLSDNGFLRTNAIANIENTLNSEIYPGEIVDESPLNYNVDNLNVQIWAQLN
jgi:hypothetical protein